MENATPIQLEVRVVLAHAAVQVLADREGVALLHVKGPAGDPDLRAHRSPGTDVDVLVRPAEVDRFVGALKAHGWHQQTGFTTGSAFNHAANFFHDHWGLLDVHRVWPGFEVAPGDAFDHLWRQHGAASLAGMPCAVPARAAQSLMLLLHAARSPGASAHPDVRPNWHDASPQHRAAVRALAGELHAEVGLAAALGTLDEVDGAPSAALWRTFGAAPSSTRRLDEWRARLSAAHGPAAKLTVALRSLGVNRYYLEQRLGRPPTRRDVAAEFVRRLEQGGREALARARRPR